uniref:G_PROTEIN_RECEP_F1_2 domain-containing protein n=1 Tax=Elaeophora elaphi TaxID=1147741 RepID=A0A158Q8D7_9BILA
MRNRANHLLAALALADMAVFIFMLPSGLSSLQRFYESTTFRIIFAYTKTHFAALANWFSCSAICYHHFSYHCAVLWVCNMTQVYVKCLPVTWNWTEFGLVSYYQPSSGFIFYINTSVFANAFFGVIIPVFIVAFLNVYLLRLLQIRTQQAGSEEASLGPASGNFCEQERKMTVTIVAIVSCFTITQLPSAILFLYERMISDAKTEMFAKISCITNLLVLTGKMLNVVLFCLTSASFRRKLFSTIHIWYRKCTCQQKKYLRHINMNRSATQKSSLFSTTSFQNPKFHRYSSGRGWSHAQVNDKTETFPVTIRQ